MNRVFYNRKIFPKTVVVVFGFLFLMLWIALLVPFINQGTSTKIDAMRRSEGGNVKKKICYNDAKYKCKKGEFYSCNKCRKNPYGKASIYDNPICPRHYHRDCRIGVGSSWFGLCVPNEIIACKK